MPFALSFVIPYYNSKTTINQCIQSILDQHFTCDIEIIVIDNNSHTKATEVINLECTIINEPNQGRSFARNKGAQAAQYPYICFLDSDVTLSKDWAYTVENYIKRTDFDAYECSIQNVDKKKETFLGVYRNLFRGGLYNIEDFSVRKFPVINSACCIYKKQSFENIGLFDTQLNWFEDADLSKRMFLSGGNLSIIPDANCLCFYNGNILNYILRKFNAGILGIQYLSKWEKRLDSPFKIFFDIFKMFFTSFEKALPGTKKSKWNFILFHRFLLLVNFSGHLVSRLKRIKYTNTLSIELVQHTSKIVRKNINIVLTSTHMIIRETDSKKMFIKKSDLVTKITKSFQISNSNLKKNEHE
jgi:glycosyltransferase involved in cell wall biosynthesis